MKGESPPARKVGGWLNGLLGGSEIHAVFGGAEFILARPIFFRFRRDRHDPRQIGDHVSGEELGGGAFLALYEVRQHDGEGSTECKLARGWDLVHAYAIFAHDLFLQANGKVVLGKSAIHVIGGVFNRDYHFSEHRACCLSVDANLLAKIAPPKNVPLCPCAVPLCHGADFAGRLAKGVTTMENDEKELPEAKSSITLDKNFNASGCGVGAGAKRHYFAPHVEAMLIEQWEKHRDRNTDPKEGEQ